MKSFRPILSVALALLVLFSASSFSMGLHFCSGELQNVALFAKAAPCEKERSLPPCHQKQPKPCCEDTFVTHNSEQTVQPSVIQHQATLAALYDVTTTAAVLADVIPPTTEAQLRYSDYSPPLPCPDLTVVHRVFLI